MKKRIAVLSLVFVMVLGVTLVSAQGGLPGAGWKSGHQIQNVGSTDATIQFTAYDTDGTDFDCGSFSEVSQGESVNAKIDDCVDAGFAGSAVVSADQPMAAIINVNNKGTGNAAGQYTGTDGADVSTSISFPLMKNNFHGRTTTFYVQNSSSSVNVITATFTLKNNGGTFSHVYTFPTKNDLADGEKQSATLTSAGSIVAVVNDKGANTSNPQRVTT